MSPQSLTKEIAQELLPLRQPEGHKYTFGSVLVIAGSGDKPGAAALTSEAVLASGAGAATLAAPESVFGAGVVLPEVMRLPLSEALVSLSKFDVIAVGPGLGVTPKTQEFFDELLSALLTLEKPVVLDADALNCLSKKPKTLNGGFVLTPHVGEARRLLGTNKDQELPQMAEALRRKYNAQIVLKSAETIVAGSDGKLWVNTTGNSGLATAGSGDVLTGVIAGLLAQGCEPLDGALLGVYLHGLAGDLAGAQYTEYGVRAGLVNDFLAPALRSLR